MEADHSVMMQQLQLIDGDGVFNADGLDNFVKKGKLAACGLSYAVVAIMGPQSSGKSTLMNHLFRTKFREMNAEDGRTQTTQGIWLAESVGIDPFTIIMDLEGNDGKERGQDTAFEKQAALFALAISDILLINMKSSEIGRENAANKPLMRTIFEVALQSLGPGRHTTLMFVIRDLEETPLHKLRNSLVLDMKKIWDEVPKPEYRKHTRLDETYRVEVVGLPHYIHQKQKFEEEIAELRRHFQNSIDSIGLASGGRETVVPALEFSLSSQNIWKEIKENKNLNLPNNRIMIATVRCEHIANNKLDQLRENQVWLDLKRDVEDAPVEGFGEKLSSIIANYLSEYEEEVQYFDEKIRKSKRKDVLERKTSDEVYPAYETMLGHLRAEAFANFKEKLDQSNKSRKEQLFESVFKYTEETICDFDRRSRDCLVVIKKNEQTPISNLIKDFNPFNKGSTSEGIKKNERIPIFSYFKDHINIFKPRGSSGNYFNWDPSNIRDKLRNEMSLHAISMFMKLFMDSGANLEEAKKVYKDGWKEWLLRAGRKLGRKLVDAFDWY